MKRATVNHGRIPGDLRCNWCLRKMRLGEERKEWLKFFKFDENDKSQI